MTASLGVALHVLVVACPASTYATIVDRDGHGHTMQAGARVNAGALAAAAAAATSSAPSSNCSDYTLSNNSMVDQNSVLEEQMAASVSECCELCSRDPACFAFAFQLHMHSCRMASWPSAVHKVAGQVQPGPRKMRKLRVPPKLYAHRGYVDLLPAQARALASIVAAHPAGTTYRFAAGLFRLPEGISAKDGDVFEGATSCAPARPPLPDRAVPGGGAAWQQPTAEVRQMCESKGVPPTVLSGAVILSNATQYSGRGSLLIWVVAGLTQLDSGQHGECCTLGKMQGCLGQARPACGFRNELYLGDKLFRRAPSLQNISSMSFYIQYDTPNPKGEMYKMSGGTLYFSTGSNSSSPPSVELSLLRSVFSSSASGVHVKNLVVEKIASYAQAAAIETTCSRKDANTSVPTCGWQISGVEVRFSHGRGINNHNGTSVRNSSAHHCGQLGFGGSSGVVSGCEIAWNNQAFFATGWEAGGGKWVNHLGHLEISECWVHDNFGDGLWADVASVNIEYSQNLIVNNSGAGISHEISYTAVVEGNYAASNGWGYQIWFWSGQLQIQNSRDVVVRNNTVVVHSGAANGIVIVQQNRSCIGCWPSGSPYPSLPPLPAQNVTVTKNTIVFADCHGTVGEVADHSVMDLVESGNAFDANTYILRGAKPAPGEQQHHWAWTLKNASGVAVNVGLSFDEFRARAKQEANGRIEYGVGDCDGGHFKLRGPSV